MVKRIVPRHEGKDLRNAANKEESEEIWRGRRVGLRSFAVADLAWTLTLLLPSTGCTLVHHGELGGVPRRLSRILTLTFLFVQALSPGPSCLHPWPVGLSADPLLSITGAKSWCVTRALCTH